MKYLKFLIVVSLAATIAFFSLYSIHLPTAAPAGSDKVAHFTAYLVLVLTAAILRPKSIAFYTASAILYGTLIELVQPTFGRQNELLDFVANSLGAISGGAIGVTVTRFVRHRTQAS